MTASPGGKLLALNHGLEDGFVRVRKRELEKLTTEVMQLREFLPRVLNDEVIKMLRIVKAAQRIKERHIKEQVQLQQDRVHLQSRLDAAQTECQKEREEKLLLRQQLWQCGSQLQLQANFCSGLGSASCSLLWSCSSREETVAQWLSDGKLVAFMTVASQTLESFMQSLAEEEKGQTEDHNSQDHQFVLALVGTITNIAAMTCGRDFLSTLAQDLLDTQMKLLALLRPGAFPRLKVLVLMGLYNISLCVTGLKYISENPGLMPLIWTLLDDRNWEVCLQCLRLVQSLLLDEEVLVFLGPSLLDPDLQARVGCLRTSLQPGLREVAQQTLDDMQTLQQTPLHLK